MADESYSDSEYERSMNLIYGNGLHFKDSTFDKNNILKNFNVNNVYYENVNGVRHIVLNSRDISRRKLSVYSKRNGKFRINGEISKISKYKENENIIKNVLRNETDLQNILQDSEKRFEKNSKPIGRYDLVGTELLMSLEQNGFGFQDPVLNKLLKSVFKEEPMFKIYSKIDLLSFRAGTTLRGEIIPDSFLVTQQFGLSKELNSRINEVQDQKLLQAAACAYVFHKKEEISDGKKVYAQTIRRRHRDELRKNDKNEVWNIEQIIKNVEMNIAYILYYNSERFSSF